MAISNTAAPKMWTVPPALSLFQDDDSRWAAVQARDAAADGFFVYAVRTTKIYCRPICKARLARRANVRFYATGEGALGAGFRACKRCKPEQVGFMPEERAVKRIRAFVEDQQAKRRMGEEEEKGATGITGERRTTTTAGECKMSLSEMARQTGLSKWHFHRVFKKCVGVTPFEYVRDGGSRGSRGSSIGTGISAGISTGISSSISTGISTSGVIGQWDWNRMMGDGGPTTTGTMTGSGSSISGEGELAMGAPLLSRSPATTDEGGDLEWLRRLEAGEFDGGGGGEGMRMEMGMGKGDGDDLGMGLFDEFFVWPDGGDGG